WTIVQVCGPLRQLSAEKHFLTGARAEEAETTRLADFANKPPLAPQAARHRDQSHNVMLADPTGFSPPTVKIAAVLLNLSEVLLPNRWRSGDAGLRLAHNSQLSAELNGAVRGDLACSFGVRSAHGQSPSHAISNIGSMGSRRLTPSGMVDQCHQRIDSLD